jgi:hypothetical protein
VNRKWIKAYLREHGAAAWGEMEKAWLEVGRKVGTFKTYMNLMAKSGVIVKSKEDKLYRLNPEV